MNVKFSVCVPVYNVPYLNGNNLLIKCFESVLNQSYENLELILINDGSFDDAPAICDEYANKDPRVKVIHQENKGVASALNRGLRVATGDYVRWIGSDDFFSEKSFEVLNEIVNKYPEVEVINCNRDTIHGDIIIKNAFNLLNNGAPITGQELFKDKLLTKTFEYSMPLVCKLSFLVDNNLFFQDGKIAEDTYFTPKVLLTAKSVITSDYVHQYYVIRSNSLSREQESEHKTKFVLGVLPIFYDLEILYNEVSDVTFKKILLNHLSDDYLREIYHGKLYRKRYKKHIDRKFVYRTSTKKRSMTLFFLDPTLYFYIRGYYVVLMNFFSNTKQKLFQKGI